MSKRTPGPWTYESDHTHRQYNVRMLAHMIATHDEAKHICTINNLPRHVRANRDPQIAEANARLIAAAPDLLAALKEVVRHLDYNGVLDEGNQAHAQPRRAIRLAIAKAEGTP